MGRVNVSMADLAKEMSNNTRKLISSNKGKPKYEKEANELFKKLFGVKKLASKIVRMNSYNYQNVMNAFDSKQLIYMLWNQNDVRALRSILININQLERDSSLTEKEVRKKEKLIKNAIKTLREEYGIKNTDFDENDAESFLKSYTSNWESWGDDDDVDWDDDDWDNNWDSWDRGGKKSIRAVEDAFDNAYKRGGKRRRSSLRDAVIADERPDYDDNDDRYWDDADDNDDDEIDLEDILVAIKNVNDHISKISKRVSSLEKKSVIDETPVTTQTVTPSPTTVVSYDDRALRTQLDNISKFVSNMAARQDAILSRLAQNEKILNDILEDDGDDYDDDSDMFIPGGDRVSPQEISESWNSGNTTDNNNGPINGPIRLKKPNNNG